MPEPNKVTDTPEKEDLEKLDKEPEKEPEKKPVEPPEEPEEPPVRRSAKDFIIARKDKKIKKLEAKKETKDGGKEKEDDSEFTPEGRSLIKEEIAEAVRPVLRQVRGQSDAQELREVLDKYGDPARKLKSKIEKYMNHSAYQNVPVEFIFLGLAQQGIKRAEKKEAADNEAAENATGGSQRRPKKIAKIPDIEAMSDKDFGQLVNKVRTGQF